jgi:hypothetical protein
LPESPIGVRCNGEIGSVHPAESSHAAFASNSRKYGGRRPTGDIAVSYFSVCCLYVNFC